VVYSEHTPPNNHIVGAIEHATYISNGKELLTEWWESEWSNPRRQDKVGDTSNSYLGPAPTPQRDEDMMSETDFGQRSPEMMYRYYWEQGAARGYGNPEWPINYYEMKPNQWNNIDYGAALKPVDISLKLHYGIQYVGDYLMNGSFAGDLVARATFEANFIYDISNSLEIHDSRIQVMSIEMGDFHSSWMNKDGRHESVASKGSWRVETPGDAKQTSTYGRYKPFADKNITRDHDDGEYFGDGFDGVWDMHAHYKEQWTGDALASMPEYDLDSYDTNEWPNQGFNTTYEQSYTTHSTAYQQRIRDRERAFNHQHEEHRLEGRGNDGLGNAHPASGGADIVGGVNPSWWQGGTTEFGGMGLGERSLPLTHAQKTPCVIVHFRLMPSTQHDPKSTVLAVRDLTAQVQNSTSRLYDGHTTFQTLPDSTWGVKVKHWDSSIKLWYSHRVVGELNSVNRRHFEYYFVDDVASSLNISHHRVQVLFITSGDEDPEHHSSVVVKFRIYPVEYNMTMATLEHDVPGSAKGTHSNIPNGNPTMDPIPGERQPWAPERTNHTEWGTNNQLHFAPEQAKATMAADEASNLLPDNEHSGQVNISGDPRLATQEDIGEMGEPYKDGWQVWGYRETSHLGECGVRACYDLLAAQINDTASKLYKGNVTMRSDSAYGLAGAWGMKRRNQTARTRGPLGYAMRDSASPHWSTGGDHPDDGAGRAKEYRNRPWTSDAYYRCKYTHRCPNAWGAYYTEDYRYRFTEQAFAHGRHRKIALFSEFENWRAGTHGWTWRGQQAVNRSGTDKTKWKPKGAHFSTFNFSLNHWKPEYSDNKGLVLNRQHLLKQVADHDRYIAEIQAEIDFLEKQYIVTARDGVDGDFLGQHPLSGEAQYQADHPHNFDRVRARYKRDEKVRLRDHEMLERHILFNSQCTNLDCTLLFNTSSLMLSGVIEAEGYLARTEKGTEVAVWNFESIELGPEVNITVIGTRACVILSRSSLVLNTTVYTFPGSIGGFPGGGEIVHDDTPYDVFVGYNSTHTGVRPERYHYEQHRALNRGKTEVGYPGYGNTTAWMRSDPSNSTWQSHKAGYGEYPPIPDPSGSNDYGFTNQSHRPATVNTQYWRNLLGVHSSAKNNINGPGSGNVRVYQFTVTTSATDVDEMQTVTTNAEAEQTLGGCFVLGFMGRCHRMNRQGALSPSWGTVDHSCTFPAERTQCIPHDASSKDMIRYIEGGLPRAGRVTVSREHITTGSVDGAYRWTIRFVTAVGNQEQLTIVESQLTGIGSSVATNTTTQGNSLQGSFQLQLQRPDGSLLTPLSRPLPYNSEASWMEKRIKADSNGTVLDALVMRTDATALCDHGLCDDGPTAAGGYTWTLILTTLVDNISPTSTTSPLVAEQGPAGVLVAVSNLTGTGGHANGAAVSTSLGHSESRHQQMATMNYGMPIHYGMALERETVSYIRNMMASHSKKCRAISSEVDDDWCEQHCLGSPKGGGCTSDEATSGGTTNFSNCEYRYTAMLAFCPKHQCRCDGSHTKWADNQHVFSLAFGGAGGGFGGRGGVGHGKNHPGSAYSDLQQTDLLGGSGGAIGGERPFEIRPHPDPIGKGGAGGGAIEFVALNDMTIGSFGVIKTDGEAGHQGHRAGGGGSGGGVVLVAGGVIVMDGTITANGGHGGHGRGDKSRSGGGGGGGRVSMFANSISVDGSVDVSGGSAGDCSSFGSFAQNQNYPHTPNPQHGRGRSFNPTCAGPGGTGSIHYDSQMGLTYFIDHAGSAPGSVECGDGRIAFPFGTSGSCKYIPAAGRGAAQTNHSLLLYGHEEGDLPGTGAETHTGHWSSGGGGSGGGSYSAPSDEANGFVDGDRGAANATAAVNGAHGAGYGREYRGGGGLRVNTAGQESNHAEGRSGAMYNPSLGGGGDQAARARGSDGNHLGLDSSQSDPAGVSDGARDRQWRQTNNHRGNEGNHGKLGHQGHKGRVRKLMPYSWNGPEHAIQHSRPERISFYIKLGTGTGGDAGPNGGSHRGGRPEHHTQARNWGSYFVLHGDPAGDRQYYKHLESTTQDADSAMLGISVTDSFRHAANYLHVPGAHSYDAYDELAMVHGHATGGAVLQRFVRSGWWYRVDMYIRWAVGSNENHKYDIRIDDVLTLRNGVFNGSYVSKVGLYKTHPGATWFDEIYMGPDNTARFECPISRGDGLHMPVERPVQKGWGPDHLGGETEYKPMTRHESHLSKRKIYQHNNGELLFEDGYEHRSYHADLLTRTPNGDGHHVRGSVLAGALTHVPRRGQGAVTGFGNTPGSQTHRELQDISATTASSNVGDLWRSSGGGPGAVGGAEYELQRNGVNAEGYHNSNANADGAVSAAGGTSSGRGSANGGSERKGMGGGGGRGGGDARSWTHNGRGDSEPTNGVYYWYADHIDERPKDGSDGKAMPHLQGTVSACSTDDFITWRNEGTMLHFANLTDMVMARASALKRNNFSQELPLRAQQPRVLYNNLTDSYVMWLQVDNEDHELGMAGVATSKHPNGPFELVRTFYPDGNETHDQTLFMAPDGVTAYLARTYYMTVEYIMPEPVMQPLWESVKHRDGHDSQQSSFTYDGSVNFGLNYHRAYYHIGYDDFHDVYLQRWRNEDNKWEVVCVNSVGSQRSILIPGQTIEDANELIFQSNVCNQGNDIIDSKYITTNERKIIIGQGQTGSTNQLDGGLGNGAGPLLSRFKDPTDPINNHWSPSSVPRVKAQPWGFNYIDGECGRRDFTQGMSRLDADLPYRDLTPRQKCSNIVDNAIHSTPPDMLIGVPVIVERRRAKYVAVSKLTDDYLDTSGITHSFEGELEGQSDLTSLMDAARGGMFGSSQSQFQWGPGEEIKTTFTDQVHDNEFKMEESWDDRFYQYQDNFNDRAFDSPSCINDGECPVNFEEQTREFDFKPRPLKKKGVRP
jgi:hypothetical protein